MIKPELAKTEAILTSSVQFYVPKYQREYAWGKSEAVELFEDLKNYAEAGAGQLFLGTLIFDVSQEKQGKIKIVDGQQRITTISLLLVACKRLADKINEAKIGGLIQERITFVDPTTAESRGARLIPSESIRAVFDHISESKWDGKFPVKINNKQVKRQVNRIKPVYDYFFEQISGFDRNQLSNFLKTVYESYSVRIDIQDENEAFSIFERTNARGLDLEVSDLLKNYLFQSGVESLEEEWRQIVENSEGTVLRMLKYFYVSRNGYIIKSELYKKIKIYANEVGATSLVEELSKFSSFYNVIRNADRKGIREYFENVGCVDIARDQNKHDGIYVSLEGLRLFKISQTYPLIYSALGCFVRNNNGEDSEESKNLVRLFTILEKYHFINNAICDRIGNEVEKLYADFSARFAKSDDFDRTLKDLIFGLKNKLASEDEFCSRFVDISYASSTIPLIAYIFDRVNNIGKDPGQRIPIYNSDQKISRKNHNIEHFYPRKASDGMKIDSETVEVIDNIGNLLVISFRTNSKLGNLDPKLKIEKLKNDLSGDIENLSYVQEFIRKYEKEAVSWDKQIINKRAKEIAEESYRKIWKIS